MYWDKQPGCRILSVPPYHKVLQPRDRKWFAPSQTTSKWKRQDSDQDCDVPESKLFCYHVGLPLHEDSHGFPNYDLAQYAVPVPVLVFGLVVKTRDACTASRVSAQSPGSTSDSSFGLMSTLGGGRWQLSCLGLYLPGRP